MTPWTVAFQASQPMGFSRQEYWSGLPFPSPGDLPDPRVEPGSPALQEIFYCLSHQGGPKVHSWCGTFYGFGQMYNNRYLITVSNSNFIALNILFYLVITPNTWQPLFFFPIYRLFFQSVWGSQQNWQESMETSHTLPACITIKSYIFHCPKNPVCST